MGRKPSRWTNLPRGMRARARGKKIHYYLDTGGKPRKEIPLGSDYTKAVQQWAELTASARPASAVHTFDDMVRDYQRLEFPKKAPRTQKDNEKELIQLTRYFGDPPAPLDSIEPYHVKQYMEWRVKETVKAAKAKNKKREKEGKLPLPVPENMGHVRANREKALLSHMWNFARGEGMTKLANPCAGIEGHREEGRDEVISDEMMIRILEHATPDLRFALRLAALTGQRVGDVLRMSESHISAGVLNVRQGKTRAKLRIEIVGELDALLGEIQAYKAHFKVHPLPLLVNELGQPMTASMLRTRFDDARAAAGIPKPQFQLRDLRATAATAVDDEVGIKSAQSLLGHTTEAMTADYIRHKVGKKVRPVR